jgi:hypothetical protein
MHWHGNNARIRAPGVQLAAYPPAKQPRILEGRMLNDATIDEFRVKVRGELIEPKDEGYESARKVYNATIDKRPRLIVRCSDVADVIAAVNFARDNGLLLAIRGGGHNGAGLGMCDDGLVIDLSRMRGVRVDPQSRIVRVEGGATWGDVDHVTHAFGLAVPSGIISTTGVGGLTLGGGHGYLARKYGLTIDNLVEADVVLADGRLITVNDERNEDLFWAIRGGGGNFGVVTSFLFRSHPAKTVWAGPVLWSVDRSAEVMRWYREFIPRASEDLYGFFAFLNVPPGPPFPEHLHAKTMCGVVWCYTGPLENADKVFQPILDFGPPAFALVGPMPFPALQMLFDGILPPGLQWYWKGDFVRELSDAAIAEHLKHGLELPTLLSTMHLYPVDGAVNRVGKNDTAFSHRDSKWSMVIGGIDPYPVNYERLVAVKAKWDPANLFRVNQNIKAMSS